MFLNVNATLGSVLLGSRHLSMKLNQILRFLKYLDAKVRYSQLEHFSNRESDESESESESKSENAQARTRRGSRATNSRERARDEA